LCLQQGQTHDVFGEFVQISHFMFRSDLRWFQRGEANPTRVEDQAAAFSSMVDKMLAMFEAGAPMAPAMADPGAPMHETI